ncbi:hypothetical protein HYV64_05350 [Candidatus Shapirobacteria bacterium]|nr:hypothetical protein [Candidatus Shapirobacteria bacterium]
MTKIMTVTELRKNIFSVIEAARINKQITKIMLHGEVVAEIRPKKSIKKKTTHLLDLINSFPKTKSMTVKEMDEAYRKAMMKKHGEYLSGRK